MSHKINIRNQMNEEDFSIRELFLMGYFDAPSEKIGTITDSGRKIIPPSRYQSEKFVKGSGCCKRVKMDHTVLSHS